jgi:hypothetical protein
MISHIGVPQSKDVPAIWEGLSGMLKMQGKDELVGK